MHQLLKQSSDLVRLISVDSSLLERSPCVDWLEETSTADPPHHLERGGRPAIESRQFQDCLHLGQLLHDSLDAASAKGGGCGPVAPLPSKSARGRSFLTSVV